MHAVSGIEKSLTNQINKRVTEHEDYLQSQQVKLYKAEVRSNATNEVIEPEKVKDWMLNLPTHSKSIITPVHSAKHAEANAALNTVKQEQPQYLLSASKFFKLSNPPAPSQLEGKARRKVKEQSAQPLLTEW